LVRLRRQSFVAAAVWTTRSAAPTRRAAWAGYGIGRKSSPLGRCRRRRRPWASFSSLGAPLRYADTSLLPRGFGAVSGRKPRFGGTDALAAFRCRSSVGSFAVGDTACRLSLRSSGVRHCPRLIFRGAMYDVVEESKMTPFLEADLVPPSSLLMVRRQRRALLQMSIFGGIRCGARRGFED
jgi:hypothetical protein